MCSKNVTLDPEVSIEFCSRDFTTPAIMACGSVCNNPQLTNFQGKAFVSSDCSLIAVDARVYCTTGSNSTGDTAIPAIGNSKVVFFGREFGD